MTSGGTQSWSEQVIDSMSNGRVEVTIACPGFRCSEPFYSCYTWINSYLTESLSQTKVNNWARGIFFIYSRRMCCFKGLFSRGLAYVFAVNGQGSVVAIFCLDVCRSSKVDFDVSKIFHYTSLSASSCTLSQIEPVTDQYWFKMLLRVLRGVEYFCR